MLFAALLTQEQAERIHDASLEILEDVGLLVRYKKARTIFASHGCIVDLEKHNVKFPRSVVEKYRRMMPPAFTFHGRDPKYNRTIPQDSPIIVTGSSALMISPALPILSTSFPDMISFQSLCWPMMRQTVNFR